MAPVAESTKEANKEVRRVLTQIQRGNLNRLDHLSAIRSQYRDLELGVRFHGERPHPYRLALIAAHSIALLAMVLEEESRDGSH